MSERSIETVREYKLDPKEVIAGLNGYYESDKCNSYITVRRNDVEGPAYFTAALYLSALIEWLRVDNDIFYRPGLIFDQVEAARNAAKMCCLRAHIKDEISKRGIWCDKDAGIPELVDTLFGAYDKCVEHRDKNRKDAVDLAKANRELKENICEDIMKYVRQEASRNGFDLPEEIDGEVLTVKRVFHDLLELLRQHESKIRNAERETRKAVNDQLKKDTNYVADVLSTVLEALGISKSDTVHLDIFGLKTKAIQRASVIKSEHDRYLEQLDKAAADYQALSEENQELKDNQKSDVNKLIRDYCTKNDIIAPSRYFSDEACIEYLFSEAKQECYKYLWNALKKLSPDCDALKITDYKKLVDRIFYEMSLINDNCKRCYRKHATEKFNYIRKTNKAEEEVKKLKEQLDKAVDDYKLKLKDYILKDIKKHGYRYDGLETKSIEEIVDRIIEMATCPRNEWVDWRIENLRGQISRLKDLINAMNEEVKDM